MSGVLLLLVVHGMVWFSIPFKDRGVCERNGKAMAQYIAPMVGIECFDQETQTFLMVRQTEEAPNNVTIQNNRNIITGTGADLPLVPAVIYTFRLYNGAWYGSASPLSSALPGDALTVNGTAPSAAHSMARKLFSAYSGHLFQVRRTSDNATQDIDAGTDGWADVASLLTFLGTSSGTVSKIYDQTGNANTFSQVTAGNQPVLVIKYLSNGRPVPVAKCNSGQFFRLRTGTTGIPSGANPVTVTAVICPDTASPVQNAGFYGVVEFAVVDNGAGHMFELAWTNAGTKIGGAGNGPWIGVDWENGIYNAATAHGTTVAPTQLADFIFALSKTNATSTWVIKGGPAATPTLATLYSGGLPSGYTAAFEGGISLGEGGDGSPAPIVFVEGMIAAGVSTDAADQAIQANLAQAFPATWQQGPNGLFTNSPKAISDH